MITANSWLELLLKTNLTINVIGLLIISIFIFVALKTKLKVIEIPFFVLSLILLLILVFIYPKKIIALKNIPIVPESSYVSYEYRKGSIEVSDTATIKMDTSNPEPEAMDFYKNFAEKNNLKFEGYFKSNIPGTFSGFSIYKGSGKELVRGNLSSVEENKTRIIITRIVD